MIPGQEYTDMEMWKEEFLEEEKCGLKRGVVPGQEYTNMEMWKEVFRRWKM